MGNTVYSARAHHKPDTLRNRAKQLFELASQAYLDKPTVRAAKALGVATHAYGLAFGLKRKSPVDKFVSTALALNICRDVLYASFGPFNRR